MEGDATYFYRRANEERIAALKSANANARQSHVDMAIRYEELANAIESEQAELAVPVSR
jgi:hypothetical protein